MATTTPAQQLAHARELGREAFAAGLGAAPALDPKIMAVLDGRRVGRTPEGEADTVAVLKAWLSGWHAANLAAR